MSQSSYEKRVKNILLDNHYIVIEFEDGTFVPARLLDDIFYPNKSGIGRCCYCHSADSSDNRLVSLDQKQYVCQECIRKMFQLLLDNGAKMNLQLDKFLRKEN